MVRLPPMAASALQKTGNPPAPDQRCWTVCPRLPCRPPYLHQQVPALSKPSSRKAATPLNPTTGAGGMPPPASPARLVARCALRRPHTRARRNPTQRLHRRDLADPWSALQLAEGDIPPNGLPAAQPPAPPSRDRHLLGSRSSRARPMTVRPLFSFNGRTRRSGPRAHQALATRGSS